MDFFKLALETLLASCISCSPVENPPPVIEYSGPIVILIDQKETLLGSNPHVLGKMVGAPRLGEPETPSPVGLQRSETWKRTP